MRATLNLTLGISERFFVVRTTEDQDDIVGEVLKTLVRPGHELRTALCGYLHAIGHFDVVTRHRGRLLGSQPYDAVCDIGRGRVAVLQALLTVSGGDHEVTEFLACAAGWNILKLIHGRKDRIDALRLDGSREQRIDANSTLLSQFQCKAFAQCVEARLWHHIGNSSVVMRS